MTPEQAAQLKPGDIVEHITEINYWLAKLVRLEGVWKAVNQGKGVFGIAISEHPENFTLVGHSYSGAPFEK